ncbi:MAG: two-component regulator propeller domain-containing protein [Saprospiraceae bacterium]
MRYIKPIILLLVLLSSCDRISRNNAYIEPDGEFLPPEVTKLKFTSPKPFNWINISENNKLPDPVFVDIEKLPVKPLNLLDFKPFKSPVVSSNFDFEKLPSDFFSIDSLPEDKLKYTLSLLGNPKEIITPKPEIPDTAQTNILTINKDEFKIVINDLLIDDSGDTWVASNEGLFHFDGEKCYQYGIEQGLKSININKLLADGNGKLWLGTTTNGVIIIDTKSGLIKTISQDEGLGQNGVTCMLQGNKDEVWVGSYNGGIDIINESKNTIRHLTYRLKLSENYIQYLIKDNKGRIWIGTASSGVDIIDIDKNKIRHCNYETGLHDNSVWALFESEPGIIWISTGEYVTILDMNQGKSSLLDKASGMDFSYVNAYHKDNNGNIWMGSNNGLYIVDIKKGRYKKIGIGKDFNNGRVICLKPKNENKMWLGTSEGISIVDEIQKVVYINIKKDIAADQFGQQIEDRDGNIWVGTDKGVYIINPDLTSKRFLEIYGGVMFILEDSRGKIWMGGYSEQGLFIYNKKKKTLSHFNITHGLLDNMFLPAMEDKSGKIWFSFPQIGGIMTMHVDDYKMQRLNLRTSLSDKPAVDFLEKQNGDIWISTYGKGILCLDIKAGTFQEINDTTGLKSNTISRLKIDETNKVWFGSEDGIGIIDESKSEITHIQKGHGLTVKEIGDILFHNKNALLFSTKGVVELARSDLDIQNGKSWDLKNHSKYRGLSSAQFTSLPFFSKNGNLWCSDINRISIITPEETDTSKLVTFITGIDIINQPLYFHDKTGLYEELKNSQSLGVKVDSLLKDNKDKLDEDDIIQQKDIQWSNVEGKFNLPVGLRLPYFLNYLSFQFSTTEDGHFDKKVYRYLLKGVDQKWSRPTEKSVSKSYLNLPQGNYTFQVVSKGFDGRWSPPAAFSFIILPPWWKTWWAYLFYIIGFSALAYVFSIYRSRHLKRSNTLLEEKVKIRTKALNESIIELKSTQSQLIHSEKMASLGELTAGIAHEIQNPLNFVNNFSELNKELVEELQEELKNGKIDDAIALSNDIKDNEVKINHHGKRAADIVKGMLQHSRTSSGVKELTDVNTLADEYLRLAYHGLRAKDKSFNAEMITHFDPDLPKIEVIPQDIGRVILNLITNAFYAVNQRKNLLDLAKERSSDNLIDLIESSSDANLKDLAYAPKVTVTTRLTANSQLLIAISDNGSGIPQNIVDKIFQPFFTTKPTGQGTGLGLSLAYDIVKAHGGELRVESEEGKGAEFIIQIPIS